MHIKARFLACVLLVFLPAALLSASGPPRGFDFVVTTGTSALEEALLYGVGSGGGVWVSKDATKTWENRSTGLPVRIVYPFDDNQIDRIESLAYNPLDPMQVAVATTDRVFVSSNAGSRWREIGVSSPIKRVDHFTAVAVSPHDADTIYLGTSFSGYYKSSDGGSTWRSGKDSIQHLYYGAGFYETIAAIAVSPDAPDLLYLATGIGGDLYESENGGKSWRSIGFPILGEANTTGKINAISFERDGSGDTWQPRIHLSSSDLWIYSATNGTWRMSESRAPAAADRPPIPGKALRTRIAGGRTGIYVNPTRASGDRLEEHLDLLAEHGMDTIVVDMKDDTGRLTYDTDLAAPVDAGAVNIRFSLDELLTRAHNSGVYVVGRIVVFQDPILYAFDGNSYAVHDLETGKPWGNLIRLSGSEEDNSAIYEQREFWVDPYSEFVWRYNVSIAAELERRGIDEIQFDYIRFPSDGDTSAIDYRFKRDRMRRVDAIESFLRLAREQIRIPISTDLYGFNAWYLMGGWIGQNIDMVADYVDVISPMFYPSHFPGTFLSALDYLDRAEVIYARGSNRAAAFVGERCVVRPYVQAFLIGAEREYDTDEYASYLIRQLEGVSSSSASGFTLWNASNIYYMVIESLQRFTGGLPLTAPETRDIDR